MTAWFNKFARLGEHIEKEGEIIDPSCLPVLSGKANQKVSIILCNLVSKVYSKRIEAAAHEDLEDCYQILKTRISCWKTISKAWVEALWGSNIIFATEGHESFEFLCI